MKTSLKKLFYMYKSTQQYVWQKEDEIILHVLKIMSQLKLKTSIYYIFLRELYSNSYFNWVKTVSKEFKEYL